jgi:hypothetical protein
MSLIDFAPILIALALLFIPLLSDGPPGLRRGRRREASDVPTARPDKIGKAAEPQTQGTISMRQGCHLHGLPPQPNRVHPLEPS